MGIADLVDRSAAAALEHATELQRHLRDSGSGLELSGCCEEIHRLIGDIVSMRNAAELLKRTLGDAA